MEMDIPLTGLSECPDCGFRGPVQSRANRLCEVHLRQVVGLGDAGLVQRFSTPNGQY